MTFVTKTGFDNAWDQIVEFEEYLRKHGIVIRDDSRLGIMRDQSKLVVDAWRGEPTPRFDTHVATRDFAQLNYLCDLLLPVRGTPFESQLIPRLKRLARTDPSPMAAGQQSKDRDETFDVICGAICSRFAENVTLVGPDVEMDYDGNHWALACKAAYRGHGGDNAIHKGIRQIDRSKADFGIVVVQMANIFNHESTFERDTEEETVGAYRYQQGIEVVFNEELHKCCEPFFAGAERVRKHRKGEKVRGVLFVCQTVSYLGPIRATLGTSCYHSYTRTDVGEESLIRRLNALIQHPSPRRIVVP